MERIRGLVNRVVSGHLSIVLVVPSQLLLEPDGTVLEVLVIFKRRVYCCIISVLPSALAARKHTYVWDKVYSLLSVEVNNLV